MIPPAIKQTLPYRIARDSFQLVRGAIRDPAGFALLLLGRSHCWACGSRTGRTFRRIYSPELAAGHGFSPALAAAYDRRKGLRCYRCQASGRAQGFAHSLIGLYGPPGCRSLAALCRKPGFQALAVASLNHVAWLHPFLESLPGLRYSEYGSTDPAVPSEDALALSYSDATFDLFLTSDTLEHVPDVERALAEARRVLKPGGYLVTTIPVVWDAPSTRQRAKLEGGELVHLLPPCYHGGSVNPLDCLAFYEYGADAAGIFEAAGFEVRVEAEPRERVVRTFVCRRPMGK